MDAPGELDLGLPRARTSLIGRDTVVETLTRIVTDDQRLVTLSGPGGAGKTRVALAVAEAAAPRIADGVRFVPLAGLSDPTALPEAVAGTLGLARAASQPSAEALASGIGDRRLLVVLDNFEHILDAAPLLSELLSRCPHLRILTTSRRRLDLDGEHVVALAPLDVPADHGDTPTPAELAEVASVRLLVERATSADPTFRLTDDNAGEVARICRELGGSPLAIELLAARLNVLSVQQVTKLLAADPLAIVSGGRRDLPDRQRSLRATIDWSIDLLDDDEQVALRRLSVFEHSFTIDAAEEVSACGPATLDAFAGLIDSHLVEPLAGDEEPRFAMPVPVRDVARELLRASGEHGEVHGRLVGRVLRFGTEASEGLESADETRWLDEVESELDQVRAVLAHLSTTDPQAHLRLASALGQFWLHRGFLGEGRRHLSAALDPELSARLDADLVAMAAAWEARLAADQGVVGEREGAERMLTQLDAGLAAARAAEDLDGELRCIDFLSHVLVLHGDLDRAVSITEEGIDLARKHERPWFLAQLLQRSAVFARLRGDLDVAADLAVEAWSLARMLGADRLVLHAGLTVAQLPPDDRIEDPPTLEWLFDLATELGDQRMRCMVVLSAGVEHMVAGQAHDAAERFATGVGIAHDSGYWHGTGFALMCSAALAAVAGDHVTCAVLHGAAGPVLPVLRRGMPPAYWDLYNQLVDGARTGLGSDRFESLTSDGAAIGWDRATSGALSFLDGLVDMEDGTDEQDQPAPSAVGVDSDAPPHLTPRELEVLERIAAGDTNKDIARRLDISPKTVMHHTLNIYRKLGARGRAEAAAVGLRLGLIAPTD